MSNNEEFSTIDIDGAASLSGMSRAAGNLSASAPVRGSRMVPSRSMPEGGSPSSFGPLVFSPGGISSGASVESGGRTKSLKQAKGTGRKPGTPNKKSYNELVEVAERTPGAEIRIVQTNEGLIKTKADRIRMKYYDSCRKLHIENRRTSVIAEEEGDETAPLLRSSINNSNGFLEYPVHLLPPTFFMLHIPGHEDQQSTQSSFVTVMSIWNTMMGTSLLAVPWAIKSAGLFTGLFTVVLMTVIAYYTAFIIISTHAKYHTREAPVPEFAQLCGRLLGPWWENYAAIFSLLAVLGAAIVYWVLMSTFVYDCADFFAGSRLGNHSNPNVTVTDVYCPSHPNGSNVSGFQLLDFVHDDPAPASTIFTKKTAPLFLVAMLPVISLKSPTFFTKFNSVGTLNVFFLIGVVIFLGVSWGFNVDFSTVESPMYVPMYANTFPSLSGMMALGLFIHNAIITIMKNNRHQENNSRDLAWGFALVSGTYLFIGTIFYLTFPLAKSCIEDNFLNNFHVNNTLIVIARVFLLLQLFTVFPLIMFILRSQTLLLVARNSVVGYKQIYTINSVVIIICLCFAIFMPSIGSIIRYSGALCGAVVVFLLPCLVKLSSTKKEGKLTPLNVAIHAIIMILGIANFVAQFLI